jgi:putative PEP-CTERM system TPR-repeat lipoprotein
MTRIAMTTCNVARAALIALAAVALLSACRHDDPASLLGSAKEYLAKKDNKAAVIQLKNALQIDPNQAEARFLLGKTLLDMGDPAGAESDLAKALELKYPAQQVVPPLLRARLRLGMFARIVDESAKLKLESGDATADAQTTIGQAYLAQGKADMAQAAFAAALAANPQYAPARLAQARLKAANRDLDGALAVVDAVLAGSAGDYEAWKLKGDILRVKGETDKAIAAYADAIKARSDFLPAHAALVVALLQTGKREEAARRLEAMQQVAPKHPQTLYLVALQSYQEKKFAAAREAIQQQLKLVPDNVPGMQLAGVVEFELKSYAQAEAYLVKVLHQAPDAALARRVLLASYVRTGQTDKAMEALRGAGDRIDNDSEMLALAGQVYLQAGDAKKAQEFLAKASRLDPNNSRKATSLALSHLAGGDADMAFSELDRIAASDTASTADLALIAAHVLRGEFDQALAAVAALEKKLPNDALPQYLRGSTLLAKRDLPGARASFTRALAINPGYFPAAASLANLDVLDKKPEDARKRFDAVLAADPKNMQAMLALAELRARNGGGTDEVAALIDKAVAANPTEPMPRLALISHYLRAKEEKRAVAAAQEALAALPDRPDVLDAAGQAQRLAGDTNQALASYNKLAALQPDSPLPYLRMAEVNVAAKNNDAALQSLGKALAIKPDLVDAQRGIIQLHLAAGRVAEALAVAHEVQKQRPKDPIGFVLEGDAQASRKAWKEAAAAYRAGMKQTDAPQPVARLHAALVAAGSRDEADKLTAAWMRAHPKDAIVRTYLAEGATARKDYAVATQLYREALEAQPKNPLLLNNLAWVAAQERDPKAIEYAETANQLAPNRPEIMDTLGTLLVAKGDTTRGVDLLQQAADLAPAQGAIRLNLAKALIKAKQVAAARKQLDSLAALGDKFPAQAEVAQLLKGL